MQRIRPAVAADAGALAAIYRPAVLESVATFEVDPPDAAEMARRVATITARFPWLVLDEGDAHGVTGYVYGSAHRARAAYQWSVEVSAYVHPAAQRRGIARALYTALFRILQLQGFRNMYAGITLPHPASVGLHESLGFVAVGVYHRVGYKFGHWHDVGWWERPLAEHVVDPPPPLAVGEVAARPEFAAALAASAGLVRPR